MTEYDIDKAEKRTRRQGRIALFLITTQLVLTTMVAGYFAVVTDAQNETLAKTAIEATEANRRVIAEVRHGVTAHGQAATDRSCASIKLLQFLIVIGNRRAHKLNTGSYVTDAQFRRIDRFVADACRFTDPVTGKASGQGKAQGP